MPGIAPGVHASFRDPAGVVIHHRDTIFRIIGDRGVNNWAAFQTSEAAGRLLTERKIVQTQRLSEVESQQLLRDPLIADVYDRIAGRVLVQHERIPFPSYPYEWPPEMLHAAGELTLDIAEELLQDNAGLKDASPYNVMFRGPSPVFLDVLSVEARPPGDPTWLAYGQFIRTFILPLLAQKKLGLSLDQILVSRRDGLEPEDIYRSLGLFRCLRPPYFGMVLMPVLLSAPHKAKANTESIYQPRILSNPEKAQFMLRMTYKQLRHSLHRARPRPRSSTWSEYMSSNNYTEEHFTAKKQFVQSALREFKPERILDVGCNTGYFSLMAAENASVVSIDYDPVVVGQLWSKAAANKADVLPLVVNLTRPTPGIGWRNSECASFLDRARGNFDFVMMLAVIHHMLVTERVPLNEIINLLAELTRDLALVEFISPEDSMFRRILRGRDELHRDLTIDSFETVCCSRFEIVRSQKLAGTHRALYLLRKQRT